MSYHLNAFISDDSYAHLCFLKAWHRNKSGDSKLSQTGTLEIVLTAAARKVATKPMVQKDNSPDILATETVEILA